MFMLTFPLRELFNITRHMYVIGQIRCIPLLASFPSAEHGTSKHSAQHSTCESVLIYVRGRSPGCMGRSIIARYQVHIADWKAQLMSVLLATAVAMPLSQPCSVFSHSARALACMTNVMNHAISREHCSKCIGR